MYFWRIENLKTDLAGRPLSDREALPYLVVYVVSAALASSLPQMTSNGWDNLGAALSVTVALCGTIYIYQQNGGAHGQYFLQRYFAIGWVVTVRCLVIIVVLLIALFSTLEVLGLLTDATTWYEVAFIAVAEVIVFWRIGRHVHDLSQRSTAA